MENNKMMEKVANESQAPVTMDYNTLEGFKLMQRVAQMFAQSSLVPKNYQGNVSDCVIALNMAQRMNADPFMVMQNLYIVNGRPSFSSSFLIATFNASGRFTPMQFEFAGTKDDAKCRAYAKELDSGIVLQGSWVSVQLAKDEGWYDKTDRNGKPVSKWRTMPQQMLMYRAAAFFIRAYAPEIAMGMYTTDEVEDFIDVESPQAAVPKEPVKPQPIKQEEAPVLDFEEEAAPADPEEEKGAVEIPEEEGLNADDLFSDLEPEF